MAFGETKIDQFGNTVVREENVCRPVLHEKEAVNAMHSVLDIVMHDLVRVKKLNGRSERLEPRFGLRFSGGYGYQFW